ncbi:uracil-DNA glycosylase [Vallicoccus soli]|uniref:Type-5 uracil-DNA glycosylase n=1 Tax=Vallicoccus soli TaxID=2339232 RepID=A0A3A3Z7M7_9ACTN|nr:uracil-DNA glycosylase [Vallicoccus soli]RJK97927.1 uracil-DNA glycosylase [Vallicoccus soli]
MIARGEGQDPDRLPVAPGTGWPGDPAGPSTPVARDPAQVAALAAAAPDLRELEARQSVCRACPRLVAWREDVAAARRRAYADQRYWGRPVPGWGEEHPRVLVVGLAPAAHGGNRTGRIFTGDPSGDWLFAALHRAGLAAQPTSVRAGDGQRLLGTRMLAAVRCAPPDNRPSVEERDACAPWARAEVAAVLPGLRVVVALGAFAWQASLGLLSGAGVQVPRPRPRFGHGAEVALEGPSGTLLLLGSFHPSQQNTATRRLTAPMLDDVLGRAARAAGLPAGPRGGSPAPEVG